MKWTHWVKTNDPVFALWTNLPCEVKAWQTAEGEFKLAERGLSSYAPYGHPIALVVSSTVRATPEKPWR